MKLSTTCMYLSVTLLSSYGATSRADDIDIYSSAGSSGTPNIMIVIDNASNSNANMGTCSYWDGTSPSGGSKTIGNDQCALANLAHNLPTNKDASALLYLGITTMNGVVVNLLPIDDKVFAGSTLSGISIPAGSTNRQAFILAVKNLSTTPGKTGQGAQLQETWAYYTGGNGGTTGTGILSGTAYSGTDAKTGCQRNYIIFLSGVKAGASHALDHSEYPPLTASINNAVSAGTMSSALGSKLATPISGKPENGYGIEWARFMYNYDNNPSSTGLQNIVTYSIASGATATPPAPISNSMEQYIQALSLYGGGKYFPVGTDSALLQSSILQIFNEVQSVNSVFASASLPVSVSAQGNYQNQIYLGMFRPDPNASPRWLGNLKQYQFIFNPATLSLQLGDANGAPALSTAGTGFISANATSFWTTANSGTSADTNGFYVNNPNGVSQAFDAPDGELVEKGGAAERLRINNLVGGYTASSPLVRNLYTYCLTASGCNADLTVATNTFSSTNAALLAYTNAPKQPTALSAQLINWVRGQDNAGDEAGPGGTVTVRPSIHGDVLHSRPVVINYGGSTGVIVFYGTNDGVFRAVNGNSSGTGAGSELWGFIPTEFFPALSRQRANSPQILLPSTPTGINPTPTPKDYFADGSTGVYQKLNADGSVAKAYLYITMRRGGRFMYAIDVTTPSTPKFLWKRSYTDAGFAELGQTWSRPKVAAVAGYANPVLIFGGGYDAAEDVDASTRPTDTYGRGIFILDAITGSLVWSASTGTGSTLCTGTSPTSCNVAGMNYSIPADITLLDRDRDGKVERLYATDIAGNLWRVDLEPPAGKTPDKWQVTQLSALGGTSNRKFFYAPDVVPTGPSGAATSYDAIMLGSGDREHPLYSNTSLATVNRFYMIKDIKTVNDGSGQSIVTEAALFDATSTPYNSLASGYFLTLAAGEKVVNASTTIAGTTYFGSNQPVAPSQASCIANLGIAKAYQLASFNGTATFTRRDGGGLPPSPVGGLVNIMVNGKNQLIPFLIGGGSNCTGCVPSALAPINPLLNIKRKRSRTYWYNERD